VNPYVLREGDVVMIPERRVEKHRCATGKRHRFRVRGIPAILRLSLAAAGDPRANVRYTMVVDGRVSKGAADGSGNVELPIPADARQGTLTVHAPEGDEEYVLQLGHLDPVTEVVGVQARLRNLGFYAGAVDGEWTAALDAAWAAFQRHYGLPAGPPDDASRAKLVAAHGG
jgi:hypothetical protein